MKKVFMTGGSGYIGSHVFKMIGEREYDVLVYNNISNGYRESVFYGRLAVGGLAEKDFLTWALSSFKPDSVIHFAAFIQVEESAQNTL